MQCMILAGYRDSRDLWGDNHACSGWSGYSHQAAATKHREELAIPVSV